MGLQISNVSMNPDLLETELVASTFYWHTGTDNHSILILLHFLHCSEKGPHFRDHVLIGSLFTLWVPIGSLFIFRVPIFSVLAQIRQKKPKLVSSPARVTSVKSAQVTQLETPGPIDQRTGPGPIKKWKVELSMGPFLLCQMWMKVHDIHVMW